MLTFPALPQVVSQHRFLKDVGQHAHLVTHASPVTIRGLCTLTHWNLQSDRVS